MNDRQSKSHLPHAGRDVQDRDEKRRSCTHIVLCISISAVAQMAGKKADFLDEDSDESSEEFPIEWKHVQSRLLIWIVILCPTPERLGISNKHLSLVK